MTSFVSPPGRDPGVTASKRMPASRTTNATDRSSFRQAVESVKVVSDGNGQRVRGMRLSRIVFQLLPVVVKRLLVFPVHLG